jgi:hypothetical protein
MPQRRRRRTTFPDSCHCPPPLGCHLLARFICWPACLLARLLAGPPACWPACLLARLLAGPPACWPVCLQARLWRGMPTRWRVTGRPPNERRLRKRVVHSVLSSVLCYSLDSGKPAWSDATQRFLREIHVASLLQLGPRDLFEMQARCHAFTNFLLDSNIYD